MVICQIYKTDLLSQERLLVGGGGVEAGKKIILLNCLGAVMLSWHMTDTLFSLGVIWKLCPGG